MRRARRGARSRGLPRGPRSHWRGARSRSGMRSWQLPTPRGRPHNLSATPPNARRDANSLTVSRVLRIAEYRLEHLTLTWPRPPCHRRIGRSARSLWAGRSPARKDSQSGGGPRALTASNSNAHSRLHSPTCRLRRHGRPSCKPSWRTCNASVQLARRRSAEPLLGVPEEAGL